MILRFDGLPLLVGDPVILCCREKHRREVLVPPVPETDTGSQVENTKAIESITVKELGKMPP